MGDLKPAGYQLVALTKLLRNGLNAILIADGVGVGKTIAAGYILSHLIRTGKPALVTCPPGLVEKWRLELRDKFGLVPVPVRTQEELENATEAWNYPQSRPCVYILSSSVLSRSPASSFPGPVVIDEIHAYRNTSTASWQSAKSLLSTASHRIGLSATPINNRLEDLAAELALLLKVDMEISEAILAEIWRPGRRQLLYPLLTRFSKERLGIHFAQRLVSDIIIRYPESYIREAVDAIKRTSSRPKNDSVYIDEVTYFRLAASSPAALSHSLEIEIQGASTKRDALLDLFNKHPSDHVIVFCEFEVTAQDLRSVVTDRPSFLITGSVPAFDRPYALDQFRLSGNGVLIMTSVGSEGLDLQFCSVLVNYDLTWNPMVLEQRIGRIDRIGQEKHEIHIYNFIVEGSIDERIIEVLGGKLGLVRGSVLQTAPVLSDKGLVPVHGGIKMSDEIINAQFKKEISHAKALAQAIALSSEIIPEDYSILQNISEDFCTPEGVRGDYANALPVWLERGRETERWLSKLDSESQVLRDRISYYSS